MAGRRWAFQRCRKFDSTSFCQRQGAFRPSGRRRTLFGSEVSVAGSIVKDIAFQFNPNTKQVEWNGQRLGLPVKQFTFVLNKPYGMICSRLNKQERRLGKQSVFELIKDRVDASVFDRFVSVGRLDEATTGLLILTTDGGSFTRSHRLKPRCPSGTR